jgi:hypothetical protein
VLEDAANGPRVPPVHPGPIAALPSVSLTEVVGRAGSIAAAAAEGAGRVAGRRLCGRARPHDAVLEVSRGFERLGSTFAKLGQIVAATPGMFGEHVSEVFRSCLDAGPVVPAHVVRAAVEQDLGRRLNDMFSSFDPAPIGQASLAVVHRAVTINGRPVAVKVLRPGIEATIAADLALVMPACRFVADQTGSLIAGTLETALQGLRQQLAEELDLRNEAATLSHQGQLLEGYRPSYLTVPATFPALSGRRVLTMELLDGVPVDDAAAIAAFGFDPKPRLEELIRYWLASVIRDASFHGDIHAGNLMLLRDGRLALIDWGIVGHLDGAAHAFFRRMLEGALGDDTAWGELVALLEEIYGPVLHQSMGVTSDALPELFRTVMGPSLTTPFGELSMADAISNLGPDSPLFNPDSGPSRGPIERFQGLAKNRQLRRTMNDTGANDTSFNHGMMLLAKQMMFFDRYGHLYLEDVSLLNDRDFYVALLNEHRNPAPGVDRLHGPPASRLKGASRGRDTSSS